MSPVHVLLHALPVTVMSFVHAVIENNGIEQEFFPHIGFPHIGLQGFPELYYTGSTENSHILNIQI